MTTKNSNHQELDPVQDLQIEHISIVDMLHIMEKISARLRQGEEIPRDHLEKVVNFIKNFADRCHHGKEEDILFPEMAKNSANLPLVNELLGEHQTGRDYIRGIVDSIPKAGAGTPDAFHIAVNMEGYIQLLTRHIRTESVTLFPLVEKQIAKPMQRQLGERFEELERDVIGVGKHEEYHHWIEELSRIYQS
jgi:hemerythrin-like domain-containing protein